MVCVCVFLFFSTESKGLLPLKSQRRTHSNQIPSCFAACVPRIRKLKNKNPSSMQHCAREHHLAALVPGRTRTSLPWALPFAAGASLAEPPRGHCRVALLGACAPGQRLGTPMLSCEY